MERRTFLKAASALPLIPNLDLDVKNPLDGLEPPNITGLKFTNLERHVRVNLFWNSPEEPRYYLECWHFTTEWDPLFVSIWPKNRPLPPLGPKTRDEILGYMMEKLTLCRENFRVYTAVMGFSPQDAYANGYGFEFPSWSKENGNWVLRGTTLRDPYWSRIVTREEWVDGLKTLRLNNLLEWRMEMSERFEVKRRPRWDGWTFEEEDQLLAEYERLRTRPQSA